MQSKYGEFLFFPTKFVRCNFYKNTWDSSKFGSFDPTKKIDTYPEAVKANIPDMSDDLYSELERNESWEKKNMELYMEAIGKCAQIYTTKNIIIRPHPAEDRKMWIDFARSLRFKYLGLSESVKNSSLTRQIVTPGIPIFF